MTATASVQRMHVPHFVKGTVVESAEVDHGSGFVTPRLDLDALVWARSEPGPAFDVPVAEVIEVLAATGERLRNDPAGLLAAALQANTRTNPLDSGVLERAYQSIWRSFHPDTLQAYIDGDLGGPEVLDGWAPARGVRSMPCAVRAFPPRLVHVLAGNAPGVASLTIARAALTKGVHLLKLPSNDLFTAVALLRTMAAVAPDHPTVRSFSAVYWRGGDPAVEGALFRPQFFDKLVAWGGEASIRSAVQYIGPGFELVAFDPKTSISVIGREAFDSAESLAEAAAAGGHDATYFNQQACVSSRFMFVEGSVADADRFAEALLPELGRDRQAASAVGPLPEAEVREEIQALSTLEPDYRVFGSFDGRGVVVRSAEPVDFHPDGKVVNVVPVASLQAAVRYANVATQTVGIYPAARKAEIRDQLASAGTQRVVALGGANGMPPGASHDGFFPLHRFVRWVNDEG